MGAVECFSSVKNRVISYLRYRQVRDKYDSEWMDHKKYTTINVDDKAGKKEVQEAIKIEIEFLPARSKMTFKLHRYDGLTYRKLLRSWTFQLKQLNLK